MTRSFAELTKDLSPERRERIEQRKEQLRQEMTAQGLFTHPGHTGQKPQRQAGRDLQD